MKARTHGFTIVGTLLSFVLLATTGISTGASYLIANKPLTEGEKTELIIPEWKIAGPIRHTLTYQRSGETIKFNSAEIAAKYPSCKKVEGQYGNVGRMLRLKAGDPYGFKNTPIEQYAADTWTKIGEYYYVYEAGQNFCGSDDPAGRKDPTVRDYKAITDDLKEFRKRLVTR